MPLYIGFDPGKTTGYAVIGLGACGAINVCGAELSKESIMGFLWVALDGIPQENITVVTEIPAKIGDYYTAAYMAGYLNATLEDYLYVEQLPACRKPYIPLAKALKVKGHAVDALAHLLYYISRKDGELYEKIKSIADGSV